MASTIWATTFDCADPERLAAFWAQVLGWDVDRDEDDDDEIAVVPPGGPAAGLLLFIRVPEPKTVKNRVHLDLDPDDQDAEVRRLLALGATTVDIGQGTTSWVVMADPEGNEFCVLTPRRRD